MTKHLLATIIALLASTVLVAQKRTGTDYRHDFRFSVGMASPKRFLHTNCGQINHSNVKYSPAFSLFYGYRIVEGLKVAATFSYYGNNEIWERDIYTDKEDHFRFTPAIQYEWFHRGIVTMYSDVGLTLEITHRRFASVDTPYSNRNTFHYRANFTPFGIVVGKKLYGSAELFSFGPRGLFNVGIGYRF